MWKVAAAFARAEPNVACVQARLAWYNTKENWLSRCFGIEYAMWFDLQLSGLKMLLDLPIPLGGTSVFFRVETSCAKRLGGWDAHNVTEDADLGMRLVPGRVALRLGRQRHPRGGRLPILALGQAAFPLDQGLYADLDHPYARPLTRALREFRLLGLSAACRRCCLGAVASYLAQPLFWLAIDLAAVDRPCRSGARRSLGWLGLAFPLFLAVGQAAVFFGAIWAVLRRGRCAGCARGASACFDVLAAGGLRRL